MRRIFFLLTGITILMSITSSCSFTLNGASIPKDMKTVKVQYFENTSQLVVNNLSQNFTEALKERIRSQTSLSISPSDDSDGIFSGSITGYTIAPVTVQAGNNGAPPIANASRLTITVNVKYSNKKDKKYDFEQTFSRYADFTGEVAAKEQSLIADINKQLTEDIFNKAFADWD